MSKTLQSAFNLARKPAALLAILADGEVHTMAGLMAALCPQSTDDTVVRQRLTTLRRCVPFGIVNVREVGYRLSAEGVRAVAAAMPPPEAPPPPRRYDPDEAEIIARLKRGQSLQTISAQMRVPYSKVKRIMDGRDTA